MIRAGSPGTKRTMKKTIEVMRNIIGTSVSNRVKIRRKHDSPIDADDRSPSRDGRDSGTPSCRLRSLRLEITQERIPVEERVEWSSRSDPPSSAGTT